MAEALYVALGAIIGSVGTVFFDRAVRWRRPRLSTETGTLARRSVNTARRVFAGASALGGQLRYPWAVGDATVYEDQLADDLRQAAARVNDKEFSGLVDEIAAHLRGVYATQPPPIRPFVMGSGQERREETPSEREARESNERMAAKQREQAEAGLASIEPALALLDELERHS